MSILIFFSPSQVINSAWINSMVMKGYYIHCIYGNSFVSYRKLCAMLMSAVVGIGLSTGSSGTHVLPLQLLCFTICSSWKSNHDCGPRGTQPVPSTPGTSATYWPGDSPCSCHTTCSWSLVCCMYFISTAPSWLVTRILIGVTYHASIYHRLYRDNFNAKNCHGEP